MTYNDHIASAYANTRKPAPRWEYTYDQFRAALDGGVREDPELEATKTFIAEFMQDGKFTDEQIADDESELLALTGIYWLTTTTNDFEYLREMRQNWDRWGSLSLGQLRGVLNCLRAEVLRDPAYQPFRDPDLKPIIDIIATAKANGIKQPRLHFDIDGQHVIVKPAGERSRNAGQFYVTGRYEDDLYFGKIDGQGEPDAKLAGSVVYPALQEFAQDPHGYALRHGRRTKTCMFCGRLLDTRESRYAGYGPICAGHFGLPWGEVPEDWKDE